ncbi:Nucleolar protein 12 [Hypsizygus marmoreus]|uniref:Nucleolar protein 12 n=1 Tax=Hypsizygus marmoreus TaxID=39966 RepID=A0A369J5Q2_HYPMA|nr:Nucleolar protein 12 [Hypsizygus marmoreus]
MSLSSLLISSAGRKAIDTELDALFTAKPAPTTPFKKAATAISVPGSSKDATTKKRKSVPDQDVGAESSKRSKPSPSKVGKQSAGALETTVTPAKEKTQKKEKSKKDKGKGKAKEAVETNAEEEENSDLENAYLGALAHADTHDELNDEQDGETAPSLVHESLQKNGNKKSRSGPKAKFVPTDETSEQRDQRTIFVGNLSVDVASKRPLLKQLQKHILSQVPSAKIESTRFRSVAFQAPTSKLPDDDTETNQGKAPSKTPAVTPAKTAARAHDLDRTSTWRSRQDADDTAGHSDEKQYLNSNQKKRIAFINQEFHSTADTVNAYIVFAHPQPTENRPANLPPPPTVLDPYEAARLAVRKCDGSLFMDRMIRVDLVGKKKIPGGDGNEGDVGLLETDPKSSVFVGNLDFASKEEDLRVFFEGVVSAERGPPPLAPDGEEDRSVKKPTSWVTRVRVVRDKDTQLGKGFAYIQFADRECVDEILAMEPTKLKFAKRKLRVQRCKTLPGSSISTRQGTADSKAAKTRPSAPMPVIMVPKGDPSLGEKLAGLPKDARKQYKSADADRVARRLAKKKARMAMGNKPGGNVHGKERVRERKTTGAGGATPGTMKKKKASSGRIRSEKSMAKRNGKKSG